MVKKASSTWVFLLFSSFFLYLIICGYPLFSDGMFLDGLMYAGIAKNLALGQGDFWNLYFSEYLYSEFHEHPPLAFGLQSIWYVIFGDHLWVERLYSFCTFLLLTLLVVRFWKFIVGDYKLSWLPVLFLSVIPLISWSSANNMLENTMSVFTFSSGFAYLVYVRKKKFYFLFFSAFLLICAFFCKGFTALFVLAFPFAMLLFKEGYKIRRFIFDSVAFILIVSTISCLLFVLVPESLLSIEKYFYQQVVKSINNVVTVNNRFYILYRLLTEMLIPLGIIILFLLWKRMKRLDVQQGRERKLGLAFIVVGLCGVLPIVISEKQSGFYILCVFPFLCIGLSLLIYNVVSSYQELVLEKRLQLIKIVTFCLFITSVLICSVGHNSTGRDQGKLAMLKMVLPIIKDSRLLFIEKTLWSDWNLQAYFTRYGNVSLCKSEVKTGEYLLSKSVVKRKGFQKILVSGEYGLFLFL